MFADPLRSSQDKRIEELYNYSAQSARLSFPFHHP